MVDVHPPPAGHPTDRLVGTTPAVAALRAQIRHLATFDTLGTSNVPTVLLQGETRTGKGLVARVMRESGPRTAGPFIEVNCAAIPDTRLEAELFDFEPGAFIDAKRVKVGLFEAASGDTLVLDGIDALPLGLQGKLLTAGAGSGGVCSAVYCSRPVPHHGHGLLAPASGVGIGKPLEAHIAPVNLSTQIFSGMQPCCAITSSCGHIAWSTVLTRAAL